MDGKIHRVKTTTDKGREMSGAYSGFLDEYPAGFIQNFKTGIKENWKMPLENAKQNIVSYQTPSQKRLHNSTSNNTKQDILELQQKTALKIEEEYNQANWAHSNHPYLKKKVLVKTFILSRITKALYLFP